MGYLATALRLKKESLATDSGEQAGDLLQTPQSKLEKPILIESGYLCDTFYLVANEDQAGNIEQAGGVCYLPEEIQTLLARSNGMDEKTLKDYLNKVHGVKKAFPGAKIQ